jgi:hypothetical protein
MLKDAMKAEILQEASTGTNFSHQVSIYLFIQLKIWQRAALLVHLCMTRWQQVQLRSLVSTL